MTHEPDPRTLQFKEVILCIACLIVVHLIALLIGVLGEFLISVEYLFFTAGVLPLVGIAFSFLLCFRKRWQWGQVLLTSVASGNITKGASLL